MITIEHLQKELEARKAAAANITAEMQKVEEYLSQLDARAVATRGAIEQLQALIAAAGEGASDAPQKPADDVVANGSSVPV